MLGFFHSDYPAKVLKAKWDYYAPPDRVWLLFERLYVRSALLPLRRPGEGLSLLYEIRPGGLDWRQRKPVQKGTWETQKQLGD